MLLVFSISFTFMMGSPFLLAQRANYEKGNSSNFQFGWDWGISVPGAFKLDHLQTFKPILFWNFSNFSLSYRGAHSYYPRGLIMDKGNSSNSQYGWDWGVSMSGASKLDHLQPFKPILFWNFSNSFTFILGSPFLLPQKANYGSWENFPFPNMDKTEGFECLGHSN